MGMSGTCKSIIGIVFLVAGFVLYSGTALAGFTATQVTGIALAIVGIGKLLHAGNYCPTCNAKGK